MKLARLGFGRSWELLSSELLRRCMKNHGSSEEQSDSPPTISSGTRVTLNFVWTVIAILAPVVSMLWSLHGTQRELSVKLDNLQQAIQIIQLQVSDRWTQSMMSLFASELEWRNRGITNSLQVPNPDEIVRRVPPPPTSFQSGRK